ncbi:MAG: ATP-grasp domain-containing protein [Dehalococcoidales bacterium]|nr:ATP-grasp domain-containing protein [Dehalococcoidales bacterium]
MSERVAIIYNKPDISKYHSLGEGSAVEGVTDSVIAVNRALHELGYDAFTLALIPPLSLVEEELNDLDVDIVFNLFEGFDGWPESEAAIVLYLEKLGLSFTGCSSKNLRICENKATVNKCLRAYGVPTPDWQVLYPGCAEEFSLEFPCIVKPLGEHASHGLSAKSVVNDFQSLRNQVEFIWQSYQQQSLIEDFLPGREFRGLVTGNSLLMVFPIEEIIYNLPPDKPRLLTYSAKWVQADEYFAGTREQCPADIDASLKNEIEELLKDSFKALGCRGYASIDMRQNRDGGLMVIDVNPNTDISIGGGARFLIEAMGITYNSFIEDILYLAKESNVGERLKYKHPFVEGVQASVLSD